MNEVIEISKMDFERLKAAVDWALRYFSGLEDIDPDLLRETLKRAIAPFESEKGRLPGP